MESFLEFRAEHYNALCGFDEAQAQAERLQSVVDEVGRLIVAHGLADLLGVALLHRHFDLAENERIVWSGTQSHDREGSPQAASPGELVPCVWKWSAAARRLRPLEFELSTIAPQAPRAAAALATHTDFVAEVGEQIERSGAAQWIGLATLPASTHCVQREENDATLRRSTRSWIPRDGIEVQGDVVTLWAFGATGAKEATVCSACKHKPPPDEVITDGDLLHKRPGVVCPACR